MAYKNTPAVQKVLTRANESMPSCWPNMKSFCSVVHFHFVPVKSGVEMFVRRRDKRGRTKWMQYTCSYMYTHSKSMNIVKSTGIYKKLILPMWPIIPVVMLIRIIHWLVDWLNRWFMDWLRKLIITYSVQMHGNNMHNFKTILNSTSLKLNLINLY